MAELPPERTHLSFALALHQVVAAPGADSCFSPYSAASALGLASRAARGETAAELVELLGGSADAVDAHARLLGEAAGLSAGTGEEEPVLAVANTLWAWQQLPLNEEFIAELAGWPSGTVKQAPFVDDPEGARQTINADIEHTTRGLIPELLTPGTVVRDTVASIVNALYLRAAWSYPFPEAGTAPAAFHAPGGTRTVPTMHLDERLGYAASGGWQVVTLPVVGELQAVVLLPDGELAEREAELDAAGLHDLLHAPEDAMVRLALPKFELDVRSPLTDAVQRLGVRTMFTSAADFGLLTDDPRLRVSDILHQAVLRLDESGLEGAAATAVMMRLVSMPAGDPVTVRVDRPFLFLVRHAGTGAVYFLARVVQP